MAAPHPGAPAQPLQGRSWPPLRDRAARLRPDLRAAGYCGLVRGTFLVIPRCDLSPGSEPVYTRGIKCRSALQGPATAIRGWRSGPHVPHPWAGLPRQSSTERLDPAESGGADHAVRPRERGPSGLLERSNRRYREPIGTKGTKLVERMPEAGRTPADSQSLVVDLPTSVLRPIVRNLLLRPWRTVVVDDWRDWRAIELYTAAVVLSKEIERRSKSPRVGVMLPTSGLFPVALLASWLAGRTVVPVNYLLKPHERDAVLSDANLDVVVSVSPMIEQFGELPPGIPTI